MTQLLLAWKHGDGDALKEMVPLVHDELRRLARQRMARERPGHLLQTTALVNEAYLRLVDVRQVQWRDRAHFFAMAARLMRRILVEYARARRSLKRGGGIQVTSLDAALRLSGEPGRDLVALDEALKDLAAMDPRRGQVVELRFFGGLSVDETAAVLNVSTDTVLRDWQLAKAWLLRELKRDTRDHA